MGLLRRSLFVGHGVKLTLCPKGPIGMAMITRSQFETLIERVVRRIAEATPAPATAKTGNFRYDAAGNALPDEEKVDPAGKTQMPPTQHPPTIPAAKSHVQQSADSELKGMNTKNPRAATGGAPSQKQIKVNNVKKALDKLGYTGSREGAQRTTQQLSSWYDGLDPADALVATADELAQRFANGG